MKILGIKVTFLHVCEAVLAIGALLLIASLDENSRVSAAKERAAAAAAASPAPASSSRGIRAIFAIESSKPVEVAVTSTVAGMLAFVFFRRIVVGRRLRILQSERLEDPV